MSLTTPSSAAAVLPLRTFVMVGKTWLKRTQTHPLLTDGPKRVSTALYLNFNYKHYQKTGELLAWPSWDTLTAEYGLGRTTIDDSIKALEHFQLLDVERGYDRAAQRRKGNRYRARFAARPNVRDQGPPNGPDQGPPNRLYLLDSPFLQGDLDSGEREGGLPTKEGRLTEKEQRALKRLKRLAALPKGGGQ
jgi:hypothetical protein